MSSISASTVLIVDDSPTDAALLQRLISQPGRAVRTVSSGEAACGIIESQEFALALLDVHMPRMNGYETAERLRETAHARNMPIIFVTATQSEQEHIFRGYELGAVDYLIKPIPPALLRSKVNVFCKLYDQRILIERHLAEIESHRSQLERQIAELKVLRGLVPICVACKRVRDDDGYWEAIETYLQERSEAEFSHAVCPGCSATLYPEIKFVTRT